MAWYWEKSANGHVPDASWFKDCCGCDEPVGDFRENVYNEYGVAIAALCSSCAADLATIDCHCPFCDPAAWGTGD